MSHTPYYCCLAVWDIGFADFKFDMRRLQEILAFPKAWYRTGLARRLFLGDDSLTQQPSPTSKCWSSFYTHSLYSFMYSLYSILIMIILYSIFYTHSLHHRAAHLSHHNTIIYTSFGVIFPYLRYTGPGPTDTDSPQMRSKVSRSGSGNRRTSATSFFHTIKGSGKTSCISSVVGGGNLCRNSYLYIYIPLVTATCIFIYLWRQLPV